MSRPRYRQLTHTADVRIAVWGDDEGQLLDNAVHATARVVMGRPVDLAATGSVPLAEWPTTLVGRLVCVANEVVFQLLHKDRAATGLRWTGDAPRLEVAPLPSGWLPELEVKAATYHNLHPNRRRGRLSAVLTLDI